MSTTARKSPEKATNEKTASTMKAVKEVSTPTKKAETFEDVSVNVISIGRKISKCNKLRARKEKLVEFFSKENPTQPVVKFFDSFSRNTEALEVDDLEFYNLVSEIIIDKMQESVKELEAEIVSDYKTLAA